MIIAIPTIRLGASPAAASEDDERRAQASGAPGLGPRGGGAAPIIPASAAQPAPQGRLPPILGGGAGDTRPLPGFTALN
jgi:hypothetical protein